MGAMLLRNEFASTIHVGDHGSTFGGNPGGRGGVAGRARPAHRRPASSECIAKRGDVARPRPQEDRARTPTAIADVRGLGLMVGVEFKDEAGPVVKGLRERGILATKAGDKVLRLLPPLVVKPRGDPGVPGGPRCRARAARCPA